MWNLIGCFFGLLLCVEFAIYWLISVINASTVGNARVSPGPSHGEVSINSSVYPPPFLTPPVTEALMHFAFLVKGGNFDKRHSLVLKCPVVMGGGRGWDTFTTISY